MLVLDYTSNSDTMNVKIVAVVLAVIVVAGGVGAVFVINNQNKGSVKVDAS